MYKTKKLRTLIVLALLLCLTAIDTGLAKPKKKKAVPTGTPILWQRPTDISSRDLFLGPGGAALFCLAVASSIYLMGTWLFRRDRHA